MAGNLDFDPYSDHPAPSNRGALDFDPYSDTSGSDKPVGILDAAARGFKRSLPETKSLLYGSLAAGAGLVGADGVRDWALGHYKDVQQNEIDPLANQHGIVDTVQGKGSVGEYVGDRLGNLAGQGLQSAAVSLAGAAAGSEVPIVGNVAGAVGGLLAKKTVEGAIKKKVASMLEQGIAKDVAEKAATEAGSKLARGIGTGTLAQTGMNVGQEIGTAYTGRADDAAEAGQQLTKGDAARAILAGIPAGLLDTVAEDVLGIRALHGVSGNKDIRKRIAAGIAQGMLTEGSTEAAQGFLERLGAGQSLGDKAAVLDYIENAAAGALGGGAFGAAGGIRRNTEHDQGKQGETQETPPPVLGLPAPDGTPGYGAHIVTPQGTVITPEDQSRLGTAFEQDRLDRQGADVQSVQDRNAVGLTPDVNVARAAHPAATPNVLMDGSPVPNAANGPLSRAVSVGVESGVVPTAQPDVVAQVHAEAAHAAATAAGDEVLAPTASTTVSEGGAPETGARSPMPRPPLNMDPDTGELIQHDPEQVTQYLAAQGVKGMPSLATISKTYGFDNDTARSVRKAALDVAKAAPAPTAQKAAIDTNETAANMAMQSAAQQALAGRQETTSAHQQSQPQGHAPAEGAQPGLSAESSVVPDVRRDGAVPAAQEPAVDVAPPEVRAEPAAENVAPTYDDSPDVLDSDITPPSGGAFEHRGAADLAANRAGNGAKAVKVDDGWVVRHPIEAGKESPVAAAATEAATSPTNNLPEPTEAQKEAGNYRKGHVKIGGLDISIENPAGSQRRPEWPPLANHYGYIKGSIGKDKDHVDVFLADGAEDTSRPVFVVDQHDPKTGKFDEHKVVLGATNEDEARAIYSANYSKDWTGLRGIRQMSHDEFSTWVRDPNETTKPAAVAESKATDNLVEVKDVHGQTHRVLQSELDGDKTLLRLHNKDGSPKKSVKRGNRLHRDNIAMDEQIAEHNKDIKTITRRGAKNAREEVFTKPEGVTREIKRLGLNPDSFDIREHLGGYVGVRKDQSAIAAPKKGEAHEAATAPEHVSEDGDGQHDELDAEMRGYERKAEKPAAARFANNSIFTQDKYEAARARLKSKLTQLNSGIDPEVLVDGMTIAGAYVESGVRKFSDFAKEMVSDFGSGIKPYLLSFYEAVRHYPGIDKKGMDDADVAQREFDALLAPEDVKTPAIGNPKPAPKKRAKTKEAGGDRTLRDDWPTDNIDGYEPMPGVKPEDSESGLRNGVKAEFLKDAKGYLKAVADALEAKGFTTTTSEGRGKTKALPAVSVNEAGPASSGEVSLHMVAPDGTGIYAQIGVTALRGVVPTNDAGISIMYRTTEGSSHRSGGNQWGRMDLSAADLAETLADHAIRNPWKKDSHAGSLPPVRRVIVNTVGKDGLTDAERAAGKARLDTPMDSHRPVETAQAPEPETRNNPPTEGQDDGHHRSQEPAGRGDVRQGAGLRSSEDRNDDAAANLGGGKPEQVADAGEARGAPTAAQPQPRSTGSGERSARAERTPDGDRVPASRGASPDPVVPKSDLTITDELDFSGVGAVGKFNGNLAAIRLLKTLEAEGRRATAAEQSVLARYVGWGGLPQAFRHPTSGKIAKGWDGRVAELESVLTPEELAAAGRSTQDAHYTSAKVVSAMWDAVARLGFTQGRVLEPSMGTGNFFGLMPHAMRAESALTGVELDSITGRIAKQLYQTANVQVRGFNDLRIAPESFDLAIGNPPFGSQSIHDPQYPDLSKWSIHNFFFAKSINSLRPGGVLAMVVSSSFMDANTSATRAWVGERARLLGAIRLPQTAFQQNAGTNVTTDIVFLQRLANGEKSNADEWVRVGSGSDKGNQFPLNRYFVNHPDMMLGNMVWSTQTTIGRAGAVLEARPDSDLSAELAAAIDRLPRDVYVQQGKGAVTVAREVKAAAAEAADVRVYGYFVDGNGVLRQRQTDSNGEHTDVVVESKNAGIDKRIRAMIPVRDAVRSLLAAELSPDATDKQIEAGRKALNDAYDAFVKENGRINRDVNKRALRDEADFPLLISLEKDYDKGISREAAKKEGVEPRAESAKKADIFTKRTNYPVKPVTEVSDAKSAMLASLNERGRIDLDYMASLYAGKEPDEIVSELGDLVYRTPEGAVEPADAYLSGNVKAKLAAAKAAAESNPAFRRNVAALEAVQPVDVDAADIFVQIGTPWITPKDYQDFVRETFEGRFSGRHVPQLGRWMVDIKGDNRTLNNERWGTERMGAAEIMEALLGDKQIVVKDRGATRDDPPVVNKAETAAAMGKATELQNEFVEWLWKDADRRERLARYFNDTFNTDVKRQYNGEHMSFPGMSRGVLDGGQLRPHQSAFAYRMVQDGVALADHVVGAGKTYASIAGTMEMRRLGLWRKPMIAVPNHLVDQWASDFTKLYPGAKVLAASRKDFEKSNRRRLFGRIATGDWDAVIVAHSSFGFIPVSKDAEARILQSEIQEIEKALDAVREENGKKDLSFKQLQKRKEALETKIAKLKERPRDDLLTFEELGVDSLVVDEAHEFKNLYFVTSKRNVAGLGSPEGSKKAFDMYVKTRVLSERDGGKNRVFLTGTPVSNTLSEVFHMQRYLQREELEQRGIATFDAWASVFGQVVSDWEMDAAGRFKEKTRFRKFANLPELVSIWRQVADTVTRADLIHDAEAQGKRFPLPKIKGGKPQNIVVPRSAMQAAYIGVPTPHLDEHGKQIHDPETGEPLADYTPGSIIYRMENMPKDPTEDNFLKATGDARKAGLDYRLIDPDAPDTEQSKTNVATRNIVEIYKKNDYRKGTQLVFCDLSVPSSARGKATESAQAKQPTWFVRKGGSLQHVPGVKATLSAMKDHPFFTVKEKKGYTVYDAVGGVRVADGAKKQEAIDAANAALASDPQGWRNDFEQRAIPTDEIDAYIQSWEDAKAEKDGAEDELEDSAPTVSMDELLADQSKFSVYDDMKAKLIAQGVPAEHIAFIHDYNSDLQKADLFAKMNRGDIRILIGSTQKMGAGMNVQRKLVALHHMDAPWRPSDLEQREGRIIRQGNEFYEADPDGFEIQINRYGTGETYDAKQWEIIQTKAEGIEAFKAGDASVREIDDVSSEAANAADMKGAASGNPLILESIKLNKEVKDLVAQERSFTRSRNRMETLIRQVDAGTTWGHKSLESALDMQKNLDVDGPFSLTLGGKTYTDRKEVKVEPILSLFKEAITKKDQVAAGTFRGAKVTIDGSRTGSVGVHLTIGSAHVGDTVFGVDDNVTASGFVTRLENIVAGVEKQIAGARQSIAESERQAEQAKDELQRGFPKSGELAAKRERQAKVVEALRSGKRAVDGDPDPANGAAFSRVGGTLGASGIPQGLPIERGNADAKRLTERLSKDGQVPPEFAALRRDSLPYALRYALATFERLTGNRVVVVRNLNAGQSGLRRFNGVTFRDGVAFVDENSTSPITTVAGHEFVHSLRRDNPELYALLHAEVQRQGRIQDYLSNLNNNDRAMGGKGELSEDLATEELAADAVGDALTDPAFMEAMAQRNPSKFRKIADAFIRFLDTLLGRQRDLKSNKYLSDVKAFRDVLANVLDRYTPGAAADTEAKPGFSSKSPSFYSAALRAVEEGKGAPKKADAAGWKGWLDGAVRRGEMKQSERDWLGVDDWLAKQDGPVSRADLSDYIRANQVQVKDVVLGANTNVDLPPLPEGWHVEEMEGDRVPFTVYDEDGDVMGEGMTEREARVDAMDSDEASDAGETIGDAKFKNYQLPGGENYRELLLTLPSDTPDRDSAPEYYKATTNDFRSSHFDKPNILAHVRFNERTDADGKKVLFLEELQSDWHQTGRKIGYKAAGEVKDFGSAFRNAAAGISSEDRVPDAPFKGTDEWSMLAFKRMVRWASEHGFDRIAWTTGEQQAARYGLSKKVHSIGYRKTGDTFTISTWPINSRASTGWTTVKADVKASELPDVVGKEIAEKIIAGEGVREGSRTVLSGNDLKVGGSGMRGFYDKILPSAVNKWAKKFGSKVGETSIAMQDPKQAAIKWDGAHRVEPNTPVHAIDITPAMREAALDGQPLFSRNVDGRGAVTIEHNGETFAERSGTYYLAGDNGEPRDFSRADAERTAKRVGGEAMKDDNARTWSVVLPGHVARAEEAATPMFSRVDAQASLGASLANAMNNARDVRLPAGYLLGDLMSNSKDGTLNWWHKTIGTQYNLAQKSPLFRRVYESLISQISDTSHYANAAMDLAPSLLPKFDSYKDFGKTPISGSDAKKVSDAVFDGTLRYTRAEDGRIVTANDVDSAGVRWTDEELRTRYGMNDAQVGYYREARNAIDRSLDDAAVASMIRLTDEDTFGVRDQALAAGSARRAAMVLRDHLMDQAKEDPKRAGMLNESARQVMTIADQVDRLKDRGYAPLSRFGEHTVYVTGAGIDPVFQMFESRAEANRAARALAKAYPSANIERGTLSDQQFQQFRGMTPETLELFGDILGLSTTGDEAKDKAFQEFLRAAKANRSAMKRLIHREGIEGFSTDIPRVLANFIYSNARLTAANLNSPETARAIAAIPKEQGQLKDAAINLVGFVNNPQESAAKIGAFNFAQYLGGSIAAAMVNMTGPLTMSFPWLSQYGGAWAAAKALKDAGAMAASNKATTGDVRLDEALKRAAADGVTQPQEVHQLQAYASGKGMLRTGDGTKAGDAAAKAQNHWARAMLAWGVPFALAEQFNRKMTFIAAFKMAREQGMADPYGFAVNAVNATQGVYNKANKPAWARSTLGGMAFTFKQYSINYVEMLHRMWNQGSPGSPERRAGRTGVLHAMVVMALLSGASGLPGADDLDDLLDGLMQRLGFNFNTKQAREQFFAKIVGESGAKFLEHGMSAIPGMPIDVSGRLGMGNLIPATGLFTKKKDHTKDVLELAGPTGDFASRTFQAADALTSGDVGAATKAIIPRALANAWQGIDMVRKGYYADSKGRQVLPTDMYDAVSKAIGFQPTNVAKVQQASSTAQQMVDFNRLKESEIADMFAQASISHDPGDLEDARNALRTWNSRNPDTPIRISPSQIRSRVQNMMASKQERLAKAAPKELREQVRQTLNTR